MAASLQRRAFHALVMAVALSSLLAVTVQARPPPEGPIGKQMGSISIIDHLNADLDVQCDSGFRHVDLGTIPFTRNNGFEFAIVDQNYWTCTLSAPAVPSSRALSGTFTLWARNKSFSPGHFVYWLVTTEGLYSVSNENMWVTPQDGVLVYRWPQ